MRNLRMVTQILKNDTRISAGEEAEGTLTKLHHFFSTTGFKLLVMFWDAWRYFTVRPAAAALPGTVQRPSSFTLSLLPHPHTSSSCHHSAPMRPPNRWLENLKRHRRDGNQTLQCANETERDSLVRLRARETELRQEKRATPKTTPTNNTYLFLRGGLLSVSAEPTTAFVFPHSPSPLYQSLLPDLN